MDPTAILVRRRDRTAPLFYYPNLSVFFFFNTASGTLGNTEHSNVEVRSSGSVGEETTDRRRFLSLDHSQSLDLFA